MVGLLVRAEYVVTCDPPSAEGVIRDGAVLVEGARIAAVGRYAALARRAPDAEVIGGEGLAALPGLVNAHHHGRGLSLCQQNALDGPLETWLLHFLALPPPDLYWDTLAFAASMIRSGVTAALHSHTSAAPAERYAAEVEQYAAAYQRAGLRAAIALDVRDQNFLSFDDAAFLPTLPPALREPARALVYPWPGIGLEEYLQLVERLERERQARGWSRLRFFLGPPGAQWCSDRVLAACRDTAERLDTGVHIHVLETWYQQEYGRRAYGTSVVEHLDAIGLLGPRLSAAHSIWLSERDLDLYARAGVTVVHNPSSNLRLGAGRAPVLAMRERGIPVALGLDSMALDDDEDMLRELRVASVVHRTHRVGRPRLSAHEVLAMATLGGARALLLQDQIGSLTPGKRADVVLLDLGPLRTPFLAPETDIVEAIVARARAAQVRTVLIDGEVRLRDGRLEGLDQEEIDERQRAWASAAHAAFPAERRSLVAALRPHLERFYRSWEPIEPAPRPPFPLGKGPGVR